MRARERVSTQLRDERQIRDETFQSTNPRWNRFLGPTPWRAESCAPALRCVNPGRALDNVIFKFIRAVWNVQSRLRSRERSINPARRLRTVPPKKEHLSSKTTRAPRSMTVCAADSPARPPPITMTCSVISRDALTRTRTTTNGERRSNLIAAHCRNDPTRALVVGSRGSSTNREPQNWTVSSKCPRLVGREMERDNSNNVFKEIKRINARRKFVY